MRIAILQNSIGIGGRSKVIAGFIRTISELTDDIEIHTLSDENEFATFRNHYNIPEKVGLTSYSGSTVPGTLYQQIILNFQLRDRLQKYDLIFNSNNCFLFLPKNQNYIHYVHFPISATLKTDPKYTQLSYRIGALPIKILSAYKNENISGTIFTNSEYTREFMLNDYPGSGAKTLYPPCIDSIRFNGFDGSGIVSVGSFHPNKRQLFQLKIAKKFPDTEFRIVGSKASEPYFKKCIRYKNENNLSNVEIFPDASNQVLQDLLEDSAIFLHSMKKERFGISTVEGLNHGCVPIVHDSGGQREVVPWDNLRYASAQECQMAIHSVLNGQTPPKSEVPLHLRQFTAQAFRKQVRNEVKSNSFL